MDSIKMALGLDGAADAGEVLLAVENLCAEHAYAQFQLARAQEEVLAAREATADVFVEVLAELGFLNDDEVLAAARAAYVANPDAAAVALLGTVDFVQAANPDGCNQYGHRNGHQGKPIVLRRGGSAGRRSDGGGRQLWKMTHRNNGGSGGGKWNRSDDENASAADKYNKLTDALRGVEGKLADADNRFYETMDAPDAHEDAAKEREKLHKEYDRLKEEQSRIREDYNIGIKNGTAYSPHGDDDLDREIDDFEKRYNSTPKNERWKLDKERKELEERWKNRDNPTLQAKPKKPAVKRPVAHADDLYSEIDDFEKRYNSTPKNERWKLDKERKELEEKWRNRK